MGRAMTRVHGPDFIGLQVRNVERAAAFYERELGLARRPGTPPGVVAFDTEPIPFAVREPLPGTDLDAGPPGLGVSLSLRADDAQGLHDRLRDHDVVILMDPFDTPYGRTFVFQDPEGYAIAITAPPEPRVESQAPGGGARISASGRVLRTSAAVAQPRRAVATA